LEELLYEALLLFSRADGGYCIRCRRAHRISKHGQPCPSILCPRWGRI